MTIKTKKLNKALSGAVNELLLASNDTLQNAQKYVNSGFENTYYLGYREIPLFLEKYSIGKRAVDYGCGTGRSTRFLKANGYEVIGVDISKKMLIQAKKLDNTSHYLQIDSARIPVFDGTCDLVFSCFVMLTVPSKEKMLAIFNEVYRSLREGGLFIIVTASEELYSHDWLSYKTDYKQNKNLKSGSIAKIKLRDLGIEFINYFWTDKNYTDLFKTSNFRLIEKHFPLGKLSENNKWISETKYAPYVIYVLQKGIYEDR
ncbi:MAG: class I SAM-dependent methyltransferase [Rhabdochlamydiaceae bacterium]|jgi:SAM-dependent methyltransferase